MENVREIALDTLLELERGKNFSNKLIKAVLDKYDYLEARDKAFLKRLLEGTIERKIELDFYLNSYSSVPVNKMKPLIRCLMRMSSYQIIYMESVPDSAAVNEACKLAMKRKFQNLKGFVNAVLRKIAANKESLPLPDKKDLVSYLSVKYSMPQWIIKLWNESYGQGKTEEILKGLLVVHPVPIRFSTRLSETEREAYVKQIMEKGVKLTKSKEVPYVYLAEGLNGVGELPGFAEGKFTIQDLSSVLSIHNAGICPGDFVLDICAAPGGKSLLAAELAGAEGRVISRDVSEEKLDLILENIDRMKATNVSAEVFDATNTDESMIEKCDVVIMDVPCSGLGVMGKKSDIKYNASEEGIRELNDLQRKIVAASFQYVKKGGSLIYSTCTINPLENEKMVEWICESFPFEAENKGVQIFPGEECDGFFYAKLIRKA